MVKTAEKENKPSLAIKIKKRRRTGISVADVPSGKYETNSPGHNSTRRSYCFPFHSLTPVSPSAGDRRRPRRQPHISNPDAGLGPGDRRPVSRGPGDGSAVGPQSAGLRGSGWIRARVHLHGGGGGRGGKHAPRTRLCYRHHHGERRRQCFPHSFYGTENPKESCNSWIDYFKNGIQKKLKLIVLGRLLDGENQNKNNSYCIHYSNISIWLWA